MTGFDLHVVITKFRKMVDLLEKIFQPDWTFFPKVISPLIDTIKMSILGTVIGWRCRLRFSRPATSIRAFPSCG